MATPRVMAAMTVKMPAPVSMASTARSKQTTLSMTPPAKLKSKLTVRLESFCSSAPMRPPRPVPSTPAMAVVKIKVSMVPIVVPLFSIYNRIITQKPREFNINRQIFLSAAAAFFPEHPAQQQAGHQSGKGNAHPAESQLIQRQLAKDLAHRTQRQTDRG